MDRRASLQLKTGERALPEWMRRALLAAPGIARLVRLREDGRNFADPFAFVDRVLRELQVQLDLVPFELENIPSAGPVIITANHPYGGLDGLTAIATIGHRRRDLRILANPDLAQLDGLGSLMIPVDPFGGPKAKRANVAGMRQAIRWLEDGGVLFIFPAGEVSHLQIRTLSVTDPPWSTTAVRLVRISGAPVVPMYFGGANSALFQLAGMVHPRLRTLLLPHELGNKLGARVSIRLGQPLPAAKLAAFDTDEQLAAHLRLKTYLLAGERRSPVRAARSVGSRERALEPIAAPIDPERLSCEIETLPPEMLLVNSGRMRVYCAPTSRIPWTLQELGRLRELTFRSVGEGTGRSADIDVFDDYYEHLFIWNTEAREIVGAYRLGRTDEISHRFGKRGLYTSTLFDYNELFIKLLGPALELGRSFVRVEYQKSFASLMLLWKGIGEYVSRQPRYCRLIGPVSISNDYRPLSRDLLVTFLRKKRFRKLAPTIVRPRTPFRGRLSLRSVGGHKTLGDIETLSTIVAELEPDGKGAPVLLRQYLKLGGRILGFNVDPDFGDAVDCLVLVDLRKTDPRILQKYMSDRGWERFSQVHRRLKPQRSAAQ
jgi:putative hemolysin